MKAIGLCCCRELDDLAVIGMGGPNSFGAHLFSTFERVREHGGAQWWLYASTCNGCGQDWMVAQDELIHDNFVLKRIQPDAMQEILDNAAWPDDFLRYEQVLRIERESGKVACFADPQDRALVETAKGLRCERPDISHDDIAFALAIPTEAVAQLLRG